MTGAMTMNRVIHAAVRRDLDRLEMALGSARDGDAARARQLQVAYAHLHDQLHRHHVGEDTHVFPFLARVGGAGRLVAVMESEHQEMADALEATRAAMDTYAATASAADAAAARESVVRATAVVERHLRHEEDELEPLLTPYLQMPEWKSLEKQLRPSTLVGSGRAIAWLQDGMGEGERAYLRSTIPPPVTFLLSRLAGRSYHRDVAPAWQPAG